MSSDSEDDEDECDEHVDNHVKNTAFQQENGTVEDNQQDAIEVFSELTSQTNIISNLSEEETDCGGNKQRSNLRVTTYRYYDIIK